MFYTGIVGLKPQSPETSVPQSQSLFRAGRCVFKPIIFDFFCELVLSDPQKSPSPWKNPSLPVPVPQNRDFETYRTGLLFIFLVYLCCESLTRNSYQVGVLEIKKHLNNQIDNEI